MDTVPEARLDHWIAGALGWRLDIRATDLDRPLDDLIARIGEPAFTALLLGIEVGLPEPFPEDLLGQVQTLGELLEFAAVKRSRRLPATTDDTTTDTTTDERTPSWTEHKDTA